MNNNRLLATGQQTSAIVAQILPTSEDIIINTDQGPAVTVSTSLTRLNTISNAAIIDGQNYKQCPKVCE